MLVILTPVVIWESSLPSQLGAEYELDLIFLHIDLEQNNNKDYHHHHQQHHQQQQQNCLFNTYIVPGTVLNYCPYFF